MIFLGAGASACFGIPTTPKLTKEMGAIIRRANPNLVEDIKAFLKSNNKDYNYENALVILMALANPAEVIVDHYSHTFLNDYPHYAHDKIDYSEIIDRMCSRICSHYTAPFNREDERFLHSQELESLLQRTYDLLMGIPLSRGVKDMVFSTNYDPSIELWSRKRFLNCVDGTSNTNNTDFRRVIPTQQYLDQLRGHIQEPPYAKDSRIEEFPLIRLHGSVWTYQSGTEATDLMKFCVPKDRLVYSDLYEDILKHKPKLIFPGQESKLRRAEWDPLYQFFKERLRGNCLFIGYSFRHDVINEPILDNLRNARIRKLGILAPNPHRNLENLLRGEELGDSFPSDLIWEMPGSFGEDTAISRLHEWFDKAYRFGVPDLLHAASDWKMERDKKYLK